MKIFLITLLLIIVLPGLKLAAQTPANDNNWTLAWSDEFTPGPPYYALPNPNVWRIGMSYETDINPWWDTINAPYIVHRNDGSNTVIHWGEGSESSIGMLTLSDRREDYTVDATVGFSHDEKGNPIRLTKPHTSHYTAGCVELRPSYFHGYGYYETRIRLPDNIQNYSYLGHYFNASFWLFNVDQTRGVDWNEIDIFEIVSETNVPYANHYLPNEHSIWEADDKMFGGIGQNSDAFFGNEKIPWDNWKHSQAYKLDYLNHFYQTFGGGWHTYGCEYLPDKIKFYIDGKLSFQLGGNYWWWCAVPAGYYFLYPPIDWIFLKMPIILSMVADGQKQLQGTLGSGISMDVDYVRYYTLNCDSTLADSMNESNYNLCTQYQKPQCIVRKKVVFGKTGCSTCHATVTSGCRVSVRAEDIILEDGFKVDANSEFYGANVYPKKWLDQK